LETENISCYCLFVRSGSEQKVAEAISEANKLRETGSEVLAVAPRRMMQEKRSGSWEKRALALLPGYVFVYGKLDADGLRRLKADNVYKLLRYDNELRELLGDDREYALWILRNHGEIGVSRVIEEGDSIRVVDGPLADCVGKIVRLDKHKRRATVEFDFDGRKRTVSLSAEVVTAYEDLTEKKSENV